MHFVSLHFHHELSFIFPQFAQVHHCCSIQFLQREQVQPIGFVGLLASWSLSLAIESTTFSRFIVLDVSCCLFDLLDEGRDGKYGASPNLEGRSVLQASQMRNWSGLTSVQMSQVHVSEGSSG